jgi:hypothetical protein
MESGEGRSGQADQSRPGDRAGGYESPGSARAGELDLWGEESTNAAPVGTSIWSEPIVSSALTRVPPNSPVSPTGDGPYLRAGSDTWTTPEPTRRQRVTTEDEFGPRRRDPYGEEPAYGPVLGYTVGWYGIPAVLYLVWLVTLDGVRQGFVGRQLVISLPWLFAAVVLSLTVAGLLRWAIVGWRALTLSFAAAVIGAGLITIAHSVAL